MEHVPINSHQRRNPIHWCSLSELQQSIVDLVFNRFLDFYPIEIRVRAIQIERVQVCCERVG